jgi:hypothetical protein
MGLSLGLVLLMAALDLIVPYRPEAIIGTLSFRQEVVLKGTPVTKTF